MANVTSIQSVKRKALTTVRSGIIDAPVRVLIYGAPKVGKSSFASGAPNPIFIGAESGTERMNVSRLQPTSWTETLEWLHELATDPHDYKTLVIDPLNWLEPLNWADVCARSGVASIEEVGLGFGKGYIAALDNWRIFLRAVEQCWKRGMHVILTAHSFVRTFQNPEGNSYDRYELAMQRGKTTDASAPFKEWVDAVLFAKIETFVKVDAKSKRAIGISTEKHVLMAKPAAAYDAGSRWKLPEDLDVAWDAFFSAVQDEGKRAGELAAQIAKMVAELNDADVTAFSAGFVEKNRTNADRLVELVNRLTAKLEEKRTKETKS